MAFVPNPTNQNELTAIENEKEAITPSKNIEYESGEMAKITEL